MPIECASILDFALNPGNCIFYLIVHSFDICSDFFFEALALREKEKLENDQI